MTEEEKKAAEEAAKAEKEKADAEFEASLDGFSDEEKTAKRTERGEAKKKTPEEVAKELLQKEGKILVDKERFNEINEQSKLYKTFAPVIDKVKDRPDVISKLLETEEKGSLEERVRKMEEDSKEKKRLEIQGAVTEAVKTWPGFEKEWSQMRKQVDYLYEQQGLPYAEAIRRSYIALHPEEAGKEADRLARLNLNNAGSFGSSGGRAPNFSKPEPDAPQLNERERKVAQDLMGKDFGGGFTPFKSEADYATALKRNEDWLKSRGFYDLP